MLWRNSVHGRAEATRVIQCYYHFIRSGLGQSIDEVNFGADGEFRPRWSVFNDLDEAFGGADVVGLLADFEAAFGVDDDVDVGVFCAHFIHVLGQKPLVDRAVALPEDDLRLAQAVGGETALKLKGSQTTISSSGIFSASRCCGRDAGRGGRRVFRSSRTTSGKHRWRYCWCRPVRRARRRMP